MSYAASWPHGRGPQSCFRWWAAASMGDDADHVRGSMGDVRSSAGPLLSIGALPCEPDTLSARSLPVSAASGR